MKNFLINEKKMFLNFFYESKLLLGIIVFFMFLSYGIKIFYFDFSIDTEVILNDYANQMAAWKSIDRLGLVFTKFLLFQNLFNPFVANYLTYLTFISACFLLCFLVQRIINVHKNKVALFILSILFLTHPVFAEQFNFVLQSFEVSLGILFLVLALLLCYYFVITNIKTFAVLSIILCGWSFLTYQSLILFFIAGAIASFILLLYGHEKDNQVKKFKDYLLIVLKYLMIFISSYVFAQLLVFIYSKYSGIQSTSYLSRQILWGKLPIEKVINEYILPQIYDVVLGRSIFYSYSFLISGILVVMILIYKLFKKNKSIYLEISAFLLLFLSPFLLTIFMGRAEVVRAQMPATQFVIAICFFYIYLHLKNKILQITFVTSCFVIAFHQSNVTANLLFSEHIKYQEDVSLVNRINFQLDSIGIKNRSVYSFVILGKHEPENILNNKGEALGHSFFAWDHGTKQGPTYRAVAFMRTLGYPYNMPTESQLDYAHTIKHEMTVWPDKNSIRIENDLIIIKLSEDTGYIGEQ
jgi:hypothetical protein